MPFTKIAAIQQLLQEKKFDGWLFYNFRNSNIFATKILELPIETFQSRRYFYFIPAKGTPQKIVHSIEQFTLDHLPGEKNIYASWQSLNNHLKKVLADKKNVTMEYSPNNAIPYLSKVDAGTVEFIRSLGINVLSSGNIVQYFEARWSDEQWKDQQEVAAILRNTVDIAFNFIGECLRNNTKVTEYDVQQEMVKNFRKNNLKFATEPNCSVNANAANPHYEPTKTSHNEIHKGDYVLIDLWAKKNKVGAVYGDIAWVAFAGEKIPDEYQKVFDIVKGARNAAVEFLKKEFSKKEKKVRGCDVDDVTRKYITERGYGEYFIHRTGHNIGEEVHGNGAHIDNYETQDEREIIPETCFSIEPGIYLPNKFGIRLEIDVYISKNYDVIIPGQPIQQEIVKIQF